MTNRYRPDVPVSLTDVAAVAERLRATIDAYLDSRVPRDAEGFFAVGLSGDEDSDTRSLYERVYQPLHGVATQLRDLFSHVGPVSIAREIDPDDETWHSLQYDVLALTGDEPDDVIAATYRSLIQ